MTYTIYKKITPEDFVVSSVIRFGQHKSYIQEKLLTDVFVIKGNLKIAEGLRKYIRKHFNKLKSLPKIKLLDAGPAIGAFTTLVALQELHRFGLMNKAQVYLADVSERVLDKTKSGDFFFPKSIIDISLKPAILEKLKHCKGYVCSASKLPFKDDYFDMAAAGFLFNHIHDDMKPAVAGELQRVVKKNGFIGIADEWFFDDYKKSYGAQHAYDEIPPAYEAIIPMNKLIKLFTSIHIRGRSKPRDVSTENYYYFWGEKKILHFLRTFNPKQIQSR